MNVRSYDAAEAGFEERARAAGGADAKLEALDVSRGAILRRALPCPRGGRYTRAHVGLPLPRHRRPDRRRQDGAGRAPRRRASTPPPSSRTPRTRSSPTSTPDRPGAALQAQLFYLLNRHRQQTALRQADLFSQVTICDYLFDKDKIYAYLNLDDNELFIYQRLYDLLARDVPPPDLVVYLQAPTDVLLEAAARPRAATPSAEPHRLDADYLQELNEAYQHFFFHYTATPLLVVETSQFDFGRSDEAVDDLVRQIRTMGQGTRYYVPRTRASD